MATAPAIKAVRGSQPNIVYFTINDLESITSGGYTAVKVFTDTSSTGAFATQDGTATLVANQQGYSYIDTDGTASTYYKLALWGATPGTSSYSPIVLSGTESYYCNSVDVRQELSAGRTDDSAIGTHDDYIIWTIIDAVTRWIDNYKRVEPGAYLAGTATATRYFAGSGTKWQEIDPATTVSVVSVEETDGTYTAWTSDTDYYTWPYNAPSNGEPYRKLEVIRKSGSSKSVFQYGPKRIKVNGIWGISASVPPDVRQIATALASRVYSAAQQAYQDASASAELGQMVYAEAQHPMIKAMLDSVFPHTRSGL